MRILTPLLIGMAATALTAGTAMAQTRVEADTPAGAEVRTASNGEWITVTGPIGDLTAEGFGLDYGDETIRVEMDGFAADGTARLQPGDWVTVTGRIDDDLWERRSIEASSVYVPRLQQRLMASAGDEEGAPMVYALIDTPDEGDWLGVTGVVTAVSPVDNEVRIDTGPMNVKVDTDALGYRTLARPGDRVSVYGQLDDTDLFDAREIDASSIVILRRS